MDIPFHTTLIATAELAAGLGAPNLVLCDVRHDLAQPDTWGAAQFAAAHLPGARFVSLDRDLSGAKTGRNGRHPLPDPASLAAFFGRLGIGPSTQVVAYDQGSGMYAARLWWMLRWLGHEAAAVLDGGYARWTAESRPVTSEPTADAAPVTFTVRAIAPTSNAEDVARDLRNDAIALIDARAPERFRGEVEPMDPVAGHIPGARNRPYLQNLNADGTFRTPAALRAEFAALLGQTPASRTVHQCGSGVTACHNLLAMEYAGLRGSRLYPGSWSEWCADPARAVARGA
jgi:thiosulfate/3-mercaptopyruvate sulfurtransferase